MVKFGRVTLLVFPLTASAIQARARQPNIIFILGDDLGYPALDDP